MTYNTLIAGIEKFGTTKEEICKSTIGVSSSQIQENVILAPWWEPGIMPTLGEAISQNESASSSIKVWKIRNETQSITYIKTGIGAPVLMDIVLALGVTACKNIIFIGSVGSLSPDIGIGDIVIPTYSICGDGASRYIKSDSLKTEDVFGEKAYPDASFTEKAKKITAQICKENSVKWHMGNTFSVDSIFAQFAHLEEIISLGCDVIEMETAAAFAAAAMAQIPMTALFSVSDNVVQNKSLLSGRTKIDMEYRSFVRETLFPQIIQALFKS